MLGLRAGLMLCVLLLASTAMAFKNCRYLDETRVATTDATKSHLKASISSFYGGDFFAKVQIVKHLTSKHYSDINGYKSKDDYYKLKITGSSCSIKICIHSIMGEPTTYEDEYQYTGCDASIVKPASSVKDRTLSHGTSVGKLHRAALRKFGSDRVPESVTATHKSIFALGDVHGDREQFCAALFSGGLVDQAKWPCELLRSFAEEHKTLVILGDVLDRGPYGQQILRTIMRWIHDQYQVYMVLGNHEVSRLLGTNVNDIHEADRPIVLPEDIRNFLLGCPLVLQIEDNVFIHGGFSFAYPECLPTGAGIPAFNQRLHTALLKLYKQKSLRSVETSEEYKLIMSPDSSPLESRSLVFQTQIPNKAVCSPLTDLLSSVGATRVFVGHTGNSNVIESRCQGRVIATDIGMTHWTSPKDGPVVGFTNPSEQPYLSFKNLPQDAQIAQVMGGVVTRYLYDMYTQRIQKETICAKVDDPSCNVRGDDGRVVSESRIAYYEENIDHLRKHPITAEECNQERYHVNKDVVITDHLNRWISDLSKHFVHKRLSVQELMAKKIDASECLAWSNLLNYLHKYQGDIKLIQFK